MGVTRRDFVRNTLAATGAVLAGGERLAHAADAGDASPPRIKLGVVGNGGRGAWIAKLFAAHRGYQLWAVADYFPNVAETCGNELGVAPSRRFSGLSGYRRLLESGVDAVALETPPYFLPEQAAAAVDAGVHVYMAKPVAVDVPGALNVLASGKKAREQRRCFLVDYQMPTDPLNADVVKRIHAGGLGKLTQIRTTGIAEGLNDPPRTGSVESLLQELKWVSEVALGCDSLGNFDIHALDAALWAIGRRPVAASGASRIARPDPHGDARDVCSIVYEYPDGLVHNHYGQSLKNNVTSELSAEIHGTEAHALLNYWGRVFLRGGTQHFGGGTVTDLYQAGAERNIARFYDDIVTQNFTNPTLERSVDGVLTSVLGMEAAARRTRLTMDAVIQENKRLQVDLRGLKD